MAHSRLSLHPILFEPLNPSPHALTESAQLLNFGPGDMVLPLLEACKGGDTFRPIQAPLPPVPAGLGYGRLPPDMADAPASAVGMASVELAARISLLAQEFSLLTMQYKYLDARQILLRLESEIRTSEELLNRGDHALWDMNHASLLPGLTE